MKLHKADNSTERLILTAMIVDSIVCGRIASKWQNNMFRSKWANLVGLWCIQYYEKYGKAPVRNIERKYRSWVEKTKDKDTVTLVEKFVSGLSDDYVKLKRESNAEYVLDEAGRYFSRIAVERLRDGIEGDLDDGDVEKALERINSFGEVKMGKGEVIDVLHDKEAWKSAFADEPEGIVKYPGLMGKFIGNQLGRDCLVGFMGPEGRGKSFLLMDIAIRAAMQRRRVVLFEAGDMSEHQIMRRIICRLSKRPFYPCRIEIPLSIRRLKKSDRYIVNTKEKEFKQRLDWRDMERACRKLNKQVIRSKDPYLKLSCHPNSTLHTKHIESYLRESAREGWMADVAIIDYSDILDMSYPKTEGRDRIDRTWRELRKISQMYHCLVVTATQTNRESYDAKIITRKHSSEDKRKLAHVTAMLGMNQTEEEKKQGIMRFNWIKVRDAEYLENKCVCVAGCLGLGNLIMRSTM